MKQRLIAAILFFPLLLAHAHAGMDEGMAAYKRADYAAALKESRDATALKEFRPAAERGAPAAQYILGNAYADGAGVPQSAIEAEKISALVAPHQG